MAQLHGKLPSDVWLSSEDLLTSAIFGTLKNLPDPIAAALLSRAQPLEGTRPLVLSSPLQWHFWPWWDVCEPDVVLEDDENLCIIEAKLYSDFGEDATAGSQLRREWTDGLQRALDEGKELWLVTLTNHTTIPRAAIERQLVRANAEPTQVCWLSWLEVGRFLRGLRDDPTGGWAEDLLELLSRMGLAPFDGFGQVLEESIALARAVGAASAKGWRFPSASGLGGVGFGPALSAAREWAQKGDGQWQPRLT